MRAKARSPFMSWTHLVLPVVAGILSLTACDRILGVIDPNFPSDAQEFSPPPVYATWWNMVRVCSATTGSLDGVKWFKTSQRLHDFRTGEELGGYWFSLGNRIVLTTPYLLEGSVVRHEMLHSLLGGGGHPRAQFLGNCAGTVHCQGRCIDDAGPYPQPPESPTHLRGDSLDITLDIEPRNPSSAQAGGFFSVTVMVRNPSTRWVAVPNYFSQYFPDIDSTKTFEFEVRGPQGGTGRGEIGLDPSEMIFAPGEIKKQVFDFSIGNRLGALEHTLPPGNYTARGGYANWMSSYSPFVIGP